MSSNEINIHPGLYKFGRKPETIPGGEKSPSPSCEEATYGISAFDEAGFGIELDEIIRRSSTLSEEALSKEDKDVKFTTEVSRVFEKYFKLVHGSNFRTIETEYGNFKLGWARYDTKNDPESPNDFTLTAAKEEPDGKHKPRYLIWAKELTEDPNGRFDSKGHPIFIYPEKGCVVEVINTPESLVPEVRINDPTVMRYVKKVADEAATQSGNILNNQHQIAKLFTGLGLSFALLTSLPTIGQVLSDAFDKVSEEVRERLPLRPELPVTLGDAPLDRYGILPVGTILKNGEKVHPSSTGMAREWLQDIDTADEEVLSRGFYGAMHLVPKDDSVGETCKTIKLQLPRSLKTNYEVWTDAEKPNLVQVSLGKQGIKACLASNDYYSPDVTGIYLKRVD